MVKKISVILVLITSEISYAQQDSQADLDAFYARQREEKYAFEARSKHDIENCKLKFDSIKSVEITSQENFKDCKLSVENKLSIFIEMQKQEACQKFHFRCN